MRKKNLVCFKQVAIVISPTMLMMVTVMTKTTMRAAISMEVTVVDQMLTPNTVQNVFVINKRRMIIHVSVLCVVCTLCLHASAI